MHDQKIAKVKPPWRTKEFLEGPVRFKHIEAILDAVTDPLRQRIRQLERACGFEPTAQQPGVEAIAPVIKNFVDARLAPIERLVHELDGDAMRYTDVYKSGRTYKRGETCTHGGGLWLALGATDTKPGSGDWKLVVKSGAFGPRDNRDAE